MGRSIVMKKFLIYVPVAGLLAFNLFYGANLYWSAHAEGENPRESAYKSMELFTRVLEKVRSDYVDADKVSYDDLVQGALVGMLSSLDPHSEFMTPEKYAELKKDTEGAFGGVGIQVGLRDNVLTAIAPMEDTPAYKAGVMPGDKIIKINDQLTQKMSLDDAVKLLRGQPGTDVTITVSRPSSGEIKEITLTRAIIKVDTVKDIDGKRAFNVDTNKIGYVKLTGFGEQTSRDLAAAISNFKKQDIKGLILDLRNTPGGLLSQAAGVCEMFLPNGQLIVSTEGRAGTGNEIKYFSRGKDHLPGVMMVVLVNGSSASASEIVSGCLQDCKRAIILGDQTFGKGSVQTVIPLPDDMALRLTTAKYYTPSHKVIHEKGITPDIVVPMTPEEEEALYLKKLEGAEDVIKNLSEEKRSFVEKVEDIQLDRARDLLRGMMILESKK